MFLLQNFALSVNKKELKLKASTLHTVGKVSGLKSCYGVYFEICLLSIQGEIFSLKNAQLLTT